MRLNEISSTVQQSVHAAYDHVLCCVLEIQNHLEGCEFKWSITHDFDTAEDNNYYWPPDQLDLLVRFTHVEEALVDYRKTLSGIIPRLPSLKDLLNTMSIPRLEKRSRISELDGLFHEFNRHVDTFDTAMRKLINEIGFDLSGEQMRRLETDHEITRFKMTQAEINFAEGWLDTYVIK